MSMNNSGNGVTRRQVLIGGAATAGLLAVGASPARAASRTPSVGRTSVHAPSAAVQWIRTAYDAVLQENLTPPAAARAYGYAAIAMYEAVVAGMPAHRSLGGQLTDLPLPAPPLHLGEIDWPTAMAAAVRPVLLAVLPFQSSTARPLIEDTYSSQLQSRRRAGVTSRRISASLAHGSSIGDALVSWIDRDGHAATLNRAFTPATGAPHLWESTPPNFRPAIEPHWSEVRPLVLRSADEVEPAPHLPFSIDPSSAFFADAMATYNQSFVNTAETRTIAQFWTDNPGSFTPPFGRPTGLPSGHWMQIMTQAAEQHSLNLAQTVEALAWLGVALFDAFLNCWTWKYRFNLLRPVTYINRYIDPAWATFVNSPQFPEHTSGHSVASRAASGVLTALLGPLSVVDDSHATRGFAARSFSSFHAAADEAAQSRIYGGIHFTTGIEVGKACGDDIAQVLLSRLRTRR